MSRLILITNDDSISAKGIRTLARLMASLGEVYVVAPDAARSGAACSVTFTQAVELKQTREFIPGSTDAPDLPPRHAMHFYRCSGTPVDCIKLACEQVIPRRPDLVVSGINHGDNASSSIHYSGTMGAVIEACMKGVPAIGYSLQTFDPDADFTPYEQAIVKIAEQTLSTGLPAGVCLNVNFPQVEELKGIKVARMGRGTWTSEWVSACHPYRSNLFWLTGHFDNLEPEAQDTDTWALNHGYASVVPIRIDMTAHDCLEKLQSSLSFS